MPIVVAATVAARRLLDVLLLVLIASVLATIVVARIVPVTTGGTTLVIAGRSMEPAIPIGSAVVAMPAQPSELRVGDVVSIKVGAAQATFTHRIDRLVTRDGGLWLATRGDGNAEPDPSIIPASSVLGRVDLTLPGLGYLIALLSSATGVLFVLGLAGTLLAGAWLLEALELDQRAARHARTTRGDALAAGVGSAPAPWAMGEAMPGPSLLERAAVLAIAYGEPISYRTPGERLTGDAGTAAPGTGSGDGNLARMPRPRGTRASRPAPPPAGAAERRASARAIRA